MNNLLKMFKIEVAGANLDDKMYSQYPDYDSSSAANAPSDIQTKNKGIAYLRYQYLTRLLSQFAVPTYYTIEYTTPGTAKTIPIGATIHVGFISYDALLQTLSVSDQAALTTDSAKEAAAALALQNFLNAALLGDGTLALEKETLTVQKSISRDSNPIAPAQYQFIEYENILVDVPSIADATVVTFVTL